MSDYTVFHKAPASLGEGLLVDNIGRQVFWADINKGELYRKSFDGRTYREYFTDGKPSAVLRLEDTRLTLCDGKGLAVLDIEMGGIVPLSENPETANNEAFRSNDGVALPGGGALYGTMECSPSGVNGDLYYFDGESTTALNIPTGIPNGFILLNDSQILIADSYKRQINLFHVNAGKATLRFERCWHDFCSDAYTPDGGCADGNGRVFIALWDGFGIAVFDESGERHGILELPVPRPTNCKLADNGKLYVTSAREGLTAEQLEKYPDSGSVFEIDLI